MDEEDEFHDFSVATAWEKFTASLEHCLHVWGPQGTGRQAVADAQQGSRRLDAQLHHRLPFRSDGYTLSLLVPAAPVPAAQPSAGSSPSSPSGGSSSPAAAAAEAALAPLLARGQLGDQPHKLQEWFGTSPVLLLAPDSYSGRVLDTQEAHTLLSAAALALAHQRLRWPLLVPVQDAVRDAYLGVAVGPGGVALRLESDSLHTSRLPTHLLQVEDQLRMFASRLAPVCPPSATTCREALAAVSRRASDIGLGEMASAASAAAAGQQQQQLQGQQGRGRGKRAQQEEEEGEQWEQAWSEASSTSEEGALPAWNDGAAGDSSAGGQPRQQQGSASDAGGQPPGGLRLGIAVRRSYEVPSPYSQEEDDFLADEDTVPDWDLDAPWRPWAAEVDPVGCLELDAVHCYDSPAAALAAEAEGGPAAQCRGCDPHPIPGCSCQWRLVVLRQGYERDTGQRGFVLRVAERRRQFLHLQSILPPPGAASASLPPAGPPTTPAGAGNGIPGEAADSNGASSSSSGGGGSGGSELSGPSSWEAVGPEVVAGPGGFYGMLSALQDSCKYAAQAEAVGQLASETWWLQRGAYLPTEPPEWVLQDMIRDILHAPGLPAWPGPRLWGLDSSKDAAAQDGELGTGAAKGGSHMVGKAAPLSALFTRFALHCLVMGSPRAAALLWGRLVRELRFAHWDTLTPLPRMPPTAGPSLPPARQRGSSRGGSGKGEGPVTAPAAAGMGGAGSGPAADGRGADVDLGTCLVHQKLQLLQLCIHLVRQQQQGQHAQRAQQGTAAAAGGSQQPGPTSRPSGPSGAGNKPEWEWESWGDFSAPTTPKANGPSGTATSAPHATITAGPSAWSEAGALAAAAGASAPAELAGAGVLPMPLAEGWEGGSGGLGGAAAAGETADDGGSVHSMQHSEGSEGSSYHSADEGQSVHSGGRSSPEKDAAAAGAAKAEAGSSREGETPAGTAPGSEAGPGVEPLPVEALAAPSAAAAAVATAVAAAVGAEREGRGGTEEPLGEGVVGYLPPPGLLHHPSRRVAIPATQSPPPCTEDVLLERELAMRALHLLGDSQDYAPQVRARLQGALLASDISAFKAANPAAALEDFMRWHSTCDWQGGELSARMAAEASVWRQLWESAVAVPAARQRPLFDPVLEGERALHFLETLPPALLFGDVLGSGLSAAMGLLGKAGAAGLPAVRAQLDRLCAISAAQLQHGVVACPLSPPPPLLPNSRSGSGSSGGGGELSGAASGGSPAPDRDDCLALSPLLRQLYQHALGLEGFGALLRMLGGVEHTVAAGQSLLQRLSLPLIAGQGAAAAAAAAGPAPADPRGFAWAAADALVASALGLRPQQAQQLPGAAARPVGSAPPGAEEPFGTAWVVPAAHRGSMRALLGAGHSRDLSEKEEEDERAPSEGPESSGEEGAWKGPSASAAGEGGRGRIGSNSSLEGAGASAAAGGEWPRPFLKEWLYEVSEAQRLLLPPEPQQPVSQQQQEEGGGDPGSGIMGGSALTAGRGLGGQAGGAEVRHRMYVKALPAELRVATLLARSSW